MCKPKATLFILLGLVALFRPTSAFGHSTAPERAKTSGITSRATSRAVEELAVPAPLKIRESVEAIRKRLGVPGIAVSLTVGDEIVFEGGFGVRELGKPDPVTAHTPFPINSTSKAFTALMLSLLVEEDRLQWNDPLADRVDGLESRHSAVFDAASISDAASHTTGLNPGGLLGFSSDLSRREMVSRLIDLDHSDFEAGRFTYNNIVYAALGLVIENVADQTWEQTITAHLLEPLGMTESAGSYEALKNKQPRATAHVSRDGGWTPKPSSQGGTGALRSAGGIISTAHDLALFTRALVGRGEDAGVQRIDPGVFQATIRPQTIVRSSPEGWLRLSFPDCNTFTYGRGWFIAEAAGSRVVFHPGGGGGMSALVMLIPDHHIGVTVLANDNDYAALFATANTLVDMVLQRQTRDWVERLLPQKTDHEDVARGHAEILARRPAQSLPPLEIDHYVGRYEHAHYGGVEIALDGGELTIRRGGLVGTLEPWDRDSFLVTYPASTFFYDIVTFRIASDRMPVELVFFDEPGFNRVGATGHGHGH